MSPGIIWHAPPGVRSHSPPASQAVALAAEHSIEYGGLDASVAPSKDAASLTDAFESLGLGRFGDSGTLAVCELVTAAVKAIPLRLCGYSGLMLPTQPAVSARKRLPTLPRERWQEWLPHRRHAPSGCTLGTALPAPLWGP